MTERAPGADAGREAEPDAGTEAEPEAGHEAEAEEPAGPLAEFEAVAEGMRESMFGSPIQRITGLVIVVLVIFGIMFGMRATERQQAASSQSPEPPAVTESATP